eukprot:5135095-Lingulodinium_polyedra.AAC.1
MRQVRSGIVLQWCSFECLYSGLPQVRSAVAQAPLSSVRQFEVFRWWIRHRAPPQGNGRAVA